MIALVRHQKWNVYISRDENDFYRRDAVVDSETFGRYAEKKGWKIVAGLEDLCEEEKDALFGFYDGKQEGENHLLDIVRRLNRGFAFDIQKTLECKYVHVYRKLELRLSEMEREKP